MNNIKIETISPIHIGDDDNKNLNSIVDFIVENGKIKIIDHNKFDRIFEANEDIMEDYIKKLQIFSGRKYSVRDFLREHIINIDEVIDKREIPIIGKFDGKEIHRFISENGKRYIPGSTIKGAIRNSLAVYYLNKHKDISNNIINKHYKKNANVNFNIEDKKIFGTDPFSDILKYLQITDTVFFDSDTNAVYSCKNYHIKKEEQQTPINYECIMPNSNTEFRIKINKNIAKRRMNNLDIEFWKEYLSIEKIFEALNNLSLAFIERELDELSEVGGLKSTSEFYNKLSEEIKESNNQKAYFCIGKGTTIMGKTMLLNLTRKELHSLRNKMKNTKVSGNFGWKYVKGKGMQSSSIFPVTRLAYDNGKNLQAGLGWLRMEQK